jgi:predicted DNA-binding WGR domain protein
MQFFTRIDQAKRISRFWLSHVTPTLFGGWALLREWGRIGSPGTISMRTYDDERAALKAEQQGVRKRERHGYKPTADVAARWSQIMSAGGSIQEARKRSQMRPQCRPARPEQPELFRRD